MHGSLDFLKEDQFWKKIPFLLRNRFKSYDVCMGFCNAAEANNDYDSMSGGANGAENPSGVPDFVREPPLGPRPDRIPEQPDKESPEYEEYDAANCEVSVNCKGTGP